jgi:molecular chaperone DnaJ
MSLDEYYERLGLPSAASPAEVKRAYRRLRAKYHPDRNKGDESAAEPAFKRVQEAFEILTGKRNAPARSAPASQTGSRAPEARQRNQGREEAVRTRSRTHDHADNARTGEDRPRQPRPDGGPPPNSGFTAESGPLPVRGANRHTQLYVPLEIAMNGGEVPASYQVTATCRHCNGMSAPHMAQPCAQCFGRGRLQDASVCEACAGRGRIRTNAWCPACQNKGVELLPKSDTIAVPPGAWDGQRLIVTGGGFPGLHGGPPGDAIFTIAILCGADFTRDGLDLTAKIDVDFVTATLGGAIEANVFGRVLPIEIPANTQHGSTIRLPAQGISDSTGHRGELKLQVVLVMPTAAWHLTDDERRALRQMFAHAASRASLS